jgi:hypothetical protein
MWHQVVVPIVLFVFTLSLTPYACSRTVLVTILLLFLIYQSLSDSSLFHTIIWAKAYAIYTFIGAWVIAFLFAFTPIWSSSSWNRSSDCTDSTSWLITVLYGLISVLFLYFFRNTTIQELKRPGMYWFIGLLILLSLGGFYIDAGIAKFIADLLILAGISWIIYRAIDSEDLMSLNIGLILLASWVAFRFFQSNIPVIWRGLGFFTLGAACFILNIWLAKKRKQK